MPVVGGVEAQAIQGYAGRSAIAGPSAASVIVAGVVAVLVAGCSSAGTPAQGWAGGDAGCPIGWAGLIESPRLVAGRKAPEGSGAVAI